MKKKIAIIGSAAIVLAICALTVLLTGALGNENAAAPEVRVLRLERQSLEQSVSLTGTVYSAQFTEVHSTLSFPVQAINVRVGDRVNEGDLLAVLDMSSLEGDLRQLQASLGAAQDRSYQNLIAARNALEVAQRNVETGNDPALMGARFAVSNAQLAVEAASTQVISAGAALGNARQDLRDYRSEVRRQGYDRYEDFDPVLSQLRGAVVAAESAHRSAQSNLEIAAESLRSAEEGYRAAQVLSADLLAAHQDVVSGAQAATNFGDQQVAIQRLRDELERAEILSPVSGTVTAVPAEEGALGAGLLFVIADTENLIVKTYINEFDLAQVNLDDTVAIMADATGNTVFAGTLTRIAPTSTPGGSYAAFESEVAVSGAAGLRIGMSARLSIVTQRRGDVLALPAQAVTTSDSGERVIFIATPAEDGGYLVEAVPVTTGMEIDRLVEVAALSLAEGALVIANAEGVQAGMLITPQVQTS